ncbi:hypothetical protein [Streptomyces virginiae]|uniref:hypothetical protein n=1 Tax=Streptomyces virginiae TaxID=1961 RepID=UPI0034543765
MTPRRPAPRLLPSLIAWWALVTALLWLTGKAAYQPASITGCAASAAFLVALGEAGDRTRLWWKRRQQPKETSLR